MIDILYKNDPIFISYKHPLSATHGVVLGIRLSFFPRKVQKHREEEKFIHTPHTWGEKSRTQSSICLFLHQFSVISTVAK